MACWPVPRYCRVAMPRRSRPTPPSSVAGPGPAIQQKRHGVDARANGRPVEPRPALDAALIGQWALSYLGRFAPFRRDPASAEEHDRALAAFARAGFGRRVAEAVLACADPDAVAALLAPAE